MQVAAHQQLIIRNKPRRQRFSSVAHSLHLKSSETKTHSLVKAEKSDHKEQTPKRTVRHIHATSVMN